MTRPVQTPHKSKAEKKADALASARRWQEERKSPVAKISKSPDENRVKIKGTPRRLDREQALARARERDYESRRKTSPIAIPEAVETRHMKMRRIEMEDLTDTDDDSNALIAAARTTNEDLNFRTGILVQKAHVKEMLSLKNEVKLAMYKMDRLCESYALDSLDIH